MNDTSILNLKKNIVKNKVLCNKFIFHKSKYGVSVLIYVAFCSIYNRIELKLRNKPLGTVWQ